MSQDNNWQQQVWQQPQDPQAGPAPQPQNYGQPQGYVSAPYYPQQPQKKSRGWIVALVAVILVFLLIALTIGSCASVVGSSFGALDSLGGTSTSSEVDFLTSDAIGVIDIGGTIQYDGSTCSPEGLKSQLDIAANNAHIKGIVLRVDSGGGVATAGEEMATYVREFTEKTGKPVVVSSASLNASAAYEISSQADYIFTAKTTAIGGIGTVMQITDLSSLYEKLGISMENITSAESKDSSYGSRPLTEEERAYYQNMVNQTNEEFLQSVADGRGMTVDQVRTLATGLTFTGIEAVKNGLADEIGTREDAVSKAAQMANVTAYKTVSLKEKSADISGLLDLMMGQKMSADDVAKALKELENNGNLAK